MEYILFQVLSTMLGASIGAIVMTPITLICCARIFDPKRKQCEKTDISTNDKIAENKLSGEHSILLEKSRDSQNMIVESQSVLGNVEYKVIQQATDQKIAFASLAEEQRKTTKHIQNIEKITDAFILQSNLLTSAQQENEALKQETKRLEALVKYWTT